MNYGLNISCMVEAELAKIQRGSDWSQADEANAYEDALKFILAQNERAWADGNIRMGDYILLSERFLMCFNGPKTNSLQSIPTPVFQRTAFSTPRLRWNNLQRLVSCNSPQALCKWSILTSKTASLFSPT